MKFINTKIQGVIVIEPEKIKDKRGFFARSWDFDEFKKNGLNVKIKQCSISYNKKRGTIRGMHYQKKPYEEAKIVTCNSGKIFDVIIDLRPKSKTFKKWISGELSEENLRMNYIPEGCAHGFQTLKDNTIVQYQMSQIFKPKYYMGVRWNDSLFNISWPLKPTNISKKDTSHKDFR